MSWLKVTKYYKGGGKTDYLFLEDILEKNQETQAKDWAEYIAGGRSYGYTVYWELIDSPPRMWIEKNIFELEEKINVYKKQISFYKNFLGE